MVLEGATDKRVGCYSNCGSVQLLLNQHTAATLAFLPSLQAFMFLQGQKELQGLKKPEYKEDVAFECHRLNPRLSEPLQLLCLTAMPKEARGRERGIEEK